MTVVETILVFVAVPLAIVLLLALLIFLPGGRKRTRYKPGQPWEHAPIWYEPHPDHTPDPGHGAHGMLTSGDGHGSHEQRAVSAGPLGGARGTW